MVKRCGFDKKTANDALRVHTRLEPQGLLPLATIPMSAPLARIEIPPEVRGKVEYDPDSGTLHVRQILTHDETLALRDSMIAATDRAAVEQFWQAQRGVGAAVKKLGEYAKPVVVPQLIVRDGERRYLYEPEELDEFTWDLNSCDPKLNGDEFPVVVNLGERVVVGLSDGGGVRIENVEKVIARQLVLLAEGDDWSRTELVRWLDKELHRGGAYAGLAASESQAWLDRVVGHLLTEREADLRVLIRKRYELAKVVIPRIAEHGRGQVRAVAKMLIAGPSPRRLETSMELARILAEPDYCPYGEYRGTFDLGKHAFTRIGEMGKEDEPACAKRINDHPNVSRWLRNLESEQCRGIRPSAVAGAVFRGLHRGAS